MQCKKHKRKKNHVVIVTSDAVDANVRQFRIRPWIFQIITGAVCVIIGAVIGYFIYEEKLWELSRQHSNELQAAMKELEDDKLALEEEKSALQSEIDGLNDQIQILSETVNQKVQAENELTAVIEGQMLPTEFPLTGSASMQEAAEGDPMCIFTASSGTMVVATAGGTVTAVNDDSEYGHNIWIDHGNGYVTIYRNKGEAVVKQGDEVVQGTTLFLIGEDNTTFGYQMMKDGVYINPMDMLAISG